MEKGGYNMKNKELRMLLGKTWGVKREIPVFAENSFSQYWKNLMGWKITVINYLNFLLIFRMLFQDCLY